MRKIFSWILIGAMLFTSMMAPAPTFAVSGSTSTTHIEETIRALGIMSGNANGELGLSRSISRAEFAQMMVNASIFKDANDIKSGTSIFKDVKYDYWAAESVKIAVQSGWFTGYLDGTFKPTRLITLEEGATALLKLLGYTNADLAGSYPSAQLSKFYALGLSDGVKAKQGENLTREDAMHMFYNMMHTQTKAGQIYAQTLGHPMLGDEIDYALLVQSVTEGPFVLEKGNLRTLLPFTTNIKVYRNGTASSLEEILPYDVYYYSKNMRTVWVYSQKVTGLYTGAMPTANAPNTVVVAGVSYPIGSSEAAFALSTKGKFGVGETVTILLGMNGDVVSVLTPEVSNETIYGVVTKVEPLSYKDSSGKIISENSVMVAGTDGVQRQFLVGGLAFSAGNVVSVTYTNSESVVKQLPNMYLTGQINNDATRIGDYKFAQDAEIIDVSTSGANVKLYPNRLSNGYIGGSDVRYYTLDSEGAIDRLILNNVTGDLNTYGVVTDVDETTTMIDNVDPIPDTFMISGIYEYLINGMPGVMRTSDRLLEITDGPAMFTTKDGMVDGIYPMGGLTLTSITDIKATAGDKSFKVAQDVQVYKRIGSAYFKVNISAVSNTNAYTVKGYLDTGHRLGGMIRVIVAEEKKSE